MQGTLRRLLNRHVLAVLGEGIACWWHGMLLPRPFREVLCAVPVTDTTVTVAPPQQPSTPAAAWTCTVLGAVGRPSPPLQASTPRAQPTPPAMGPPLAPVASTAAVASWRRAPLGGLGVRTAWEAASATGPAHRGFSAQWDPHPARPSPVGATPATLQQLRCTAHRVRARPPPWGSVTTVRRPPAPRWQLLTSELDRRFARRAATAPWACRCVFVSGLLGCWAAVLQCRAFILLLMNVLVRLCSCFATRASHITSNYFPNAPTPPPSLPCVRLIAQQVAMGTSVASPLRCVRGRALWALSARRAVW